MKLSTMTRRTKWISKLLYLAIFKSSTLTSDEYDIRKIWEEYKKKMDNLPERAFWGTIGFFLWIVLLGVLVEINVHPMIGGLVLLGGVMVIVKSFGGFDW